MLYLLDRLAPRQAQDGYHGLNHNVEENLETSYLDPDNLQFRNERDHLEVNSFCSIFKILACIPDRCQKAAALFPFQASFRHKPH
jgi:hypothetical protein